MFGTSRGDAAWMLKHDRRVVEIEAGENQTRFVVSDGHGGGGAVIVRHTTKIWKAA